MSRAYGRVFRHASIAVDFVNNKSTSKEIIIVLTTD